jgi:hypothetical protein
MKKKREERVERRRPQVEPNLVGEGKSRSVVNPRGCLPFLSQVLVGLVGLGLLAAGLH